MLILSGFGFNSGAYQARIHCVYHSMDIHNGFALPPAQRPFKAHSVHCPPRDNGGKAAIADMPAPQTLLAHRSSATMHDDAGDDDERDDDCPPLRVDDGKNNNHGGGESSNAANPPPPLRDVESTTGGSKPEEEDPADLVALSSREMLSSPSPPPSSSSTGGDGKNCCYFAIWNYGDEPEAMGYAVLVMGE